MSRSKFCALRQSWVLNHGFRHCKSRLRHDVRCCCMHSVWACGGRCARYSQTQRTCTGCASIISSDPLTCASGTIKPPATQTGASVGFISPASPIYYEYNASLYNQHIYDTIAPFGWTPLFGDHAFEEWGYLAGGARSSFALHSFSFGLNLPLLVDVFQALTPIVQRM